MDDYGINDALEDLDHLEAGVSGYERAEITARLRALLRELERASVLMDDGS